VVLHSRMYGDKEYVTKIFPDWTSFEPIPLHRMLIWTQPKQDVITLSTCCEYPFHKRNTKLEIYEIQ